MPFVPYHRFDNRKKLEKIILDFSDSGNIPDPIIVNYHRYYPSFIQKLRAVKHNIDRLEEKLTTTPLQEVAISIGEFGFEVNMYIDGYFYNGGSALDILARVILTLFGENLPDNVYFQTAHQIISANRPNDPILPRIEEPPWRQSFSNYRNVLTHELILASLTQINIDASGASPIHKIIVPLPDNPRVAPVNRTYNNNPDVLDYIKTHFTRILRIANTVLGDIVQRATISGTLPL